MITIINYNAGNLTSVKRALDHLGIENRITPDPDVVARAGKIIFPGVGHAGTAMAVLRERGLDEALLQAFERGTPMMGICVGAQIALIRSEEADTICLGILPGVCPRFELDDPRLTVPHMGWNTVEVVRPHFILKDVKPGDQFYFVHSYYPRPDEESDVYATANYEHDFAAAIGRDNLFATQFHPEKSAQIGMQILKNFAEWRP
ncbi:MAG: imidazole glycerol phosphate synthase subunit HisH [Chloroflexi bacterium]|jgi:imidazole glycerol-phosphate synthase subunit HisH|nr:imidazole glycerol phosphate synthase subunit HisH [Chloroflexota bacterium]